MHSLWDRVKIHLDDALGSTNFETMRSSRFRDRSGTTCHVSSINPAAYFEAILNGREGMKAAHPLEILLLALLTTSLQAFAPSLRPLRHIISSSSLAMSTESFSLDPSETACVFIEYQNEFVTVGGKLHDAVKDCMASTNMLENSVNLATAAREAGCTIIHVPISFDPGHNEISKKPYGVLAGIKEGGAFTAGSWGSEIANEMRPQPGDQVAKGKTGLCGFESTNLDFLLRQRGIKNVVLGGFLTNCCVESTMRAAYEKGYKVYTLKDCVAATSTAAQDATLEHNFGMFSVPTTSGAILAALKTNVAA